MVDALRFCSLAICAGIISASDFLSFGANPIGLNNMYVSTQHHNMDNVLICFKLAVITDWSIVTDWLERTIRFYDYF